MNDSRTERRLKPTPLTVRMHLDDSELSRAEWQGDNLMLRFSVASADRGDVTGWQPGHAAAVSLTLVQAKAIDAPADLLGRVRSGRLLLEGQRIDPFALPAMFTGPLQLALQLANGSTLTVDAEGLEAHWQAPLRWHESYAC